ncbi:lipase 3-like [Culicoides brevitarsis]|uniref:lipase 3-like n=1 Tax=Culicoides brevitarsis TaxID=469753 RepID=UPI00307CC5E9
MSSKVFYLFLVFATITTIACDTVVDLIKAAEYPVEVHYVQTSDGFKLRMHRIPEGLRKLNYDVATGSSEETDSHHQNESSSREPVFLMHGLLCSATMWVCQSPDKSLGFMLADAGYDVWMLNARGTSFSTAHKHLDPQSKNYWDFSWHEIGMYDVPAAINYILQKTKHKKVHYVGHSQGCTVFAVALTMHPSLNKKISGAYLLTPAIYMHHMSSFVKTLMENEKELVTAANFLGIYRLEMRGSVANKLKNMICPDNDKDSNMRCSEIMYKVIGSDSGQMDRASIIYLLTKTVWDNISLKQLIHYGQVARRGKFAMYDHGALENQIRYGSRSPPEYNLETITVPTTVIYGEKDGLVNTADVEHFISKLPNVRKTIKYPWNHMDFVFGQDVDVRVNDFIIRGMRDKIHNKSDSCVVKDKSEAINACTKIALKHKDDIFIQHPPIYTLVLAA